jgi:hypothetical protein
MHADGTLGVRLARLPLSELVKLARRHGIDVDFRKVPGTRGRKIKLHSRAWMVEALESLARTGRDLGLK